MKESELQQVFANHAALLILHAQKMGFGVTLGEAHRTAEQAAMHAAAGKGIKNSLHTRRLAIDINLFKDGVYLTATEAHKELGDWWKSLGSDHFWGGDFGDGNHYSISPDGGRTK